MAIKNYYEFMRSQYNLIRLIYILPVTWLIRALLKIIYLLSFSISRAQFGVGYCMNYIPPQLELF
jgi:hypothetical protein